MATKKAKVKKGEALRVMSKELEELDSREFRKNAAIIHIPAEKQLGFFERKIINVLLVNALRELPHKLVHHISARFLYEAIGWEKSNDYQKLEEAANNIMSTVMTVNMFNEGTVEWHKVNLVQRISLLKGGIVEYEYSDWLAQRLADPEMWANIDLKMQREFKSAYALILYENVVRYEKLGYTAFRTVEVWKEILGATAPMYNEYRHLNHHVLRPAMEEINTVTKYKVTMATQGKGRKVSELKFFIEPKKQGDLPLEETTSDVEVRCELERLGFDADTIRDVIQTNPERALLAARRTREQEASKKIVGTPAAYFMGIFRRESEIKLDAHKPKRKASIPAPLSEAARENDRKADETRRVLRTLTEEQRAELRAAYIEANPGARYNEETRRWNEPKHTAGYRGFEMAQRAPAEVS
jgi:plasmid replication initiation protein